MSSASPPAADRAPATQVDGVHVLGSLSPSRAADFLSCPLRYRLRTVDRLPEPPSADAARGSLVHKVLEELFDSPALERTLERADQLVAPAWHALREAEPELASLFGDASVDDPEVAAWWSSCHRVLETYFTLEDPRRLEPAERELYVEAVLDSRLLLRGVVDRVDVAPDGAIRIVDYKTGRSPGEGYEARALFQLKIYALVLWRMRGVVPAMLQLVYLGNAEILRYTPDEQDLVATERKVVAIWTAIEEARTTGQWLPRRSALCAWCSFQALCPEFGGTPPPLPAPTAVAEPADAQDEAPAPG